MTDAQTADFVEEEKNTQYSSLGWWRAHLQRDWSEEENPTSNAGFNVLGKEGDFVFKDSESYVSSEYVHVISFQRTGIHQTGLR